MTMDEMETRRSMLAKGPGYVPERGETFTVLPGADPSAAFGKPTDIKAAIATARELLGDGSYAVVRSKPWFIITKGEVDAIEALLRCCGLCDDCAVDGDPCEDCAPLLAFAAQMKELS